MKRNGLRALGLASCVVALFSILGMAVDLNGIVANELIEEISKAAGLNLVDQYVALYTVEELTDLAANGLTPGIRLAADRALFEAKGGIGFYFATHIVEVDGEQVEQRIYDNAALLAMAEAGDADAAAAYVFDSRRGLKNVQAVVDAMSATTDQGLIHAYGELLGGIYGPGSPVGSKTEAELLALLNGDDYGQQVAAVTALTTYWIIGADLTIAQVESAILGVTLVNPGLAAAYQGYLAYLYSL